MPDNKKEYTGSVKKKLLPDSMAGKCYYKTNQKVQWIVIHNMGGMEKGVYKGGTNQGSWDWWSKGAGGNNTSAHYCVDDKEIWQCLEDNWKGVHCGPVRKGHYGADRGASNSNSIGIEIADHNKIDKNKSMELAIELARYLVKKYNLSVDNVIQHYDVSGKDCPNWIRANNKWNYFKQQVKTRNETNQPISFDPSSLSGSGAVGGGDGMAGTGDSNMPNFDNREDMTNLDDVRGVVLIHHPPEHFYSVKEHDNAWSKIPYKKEFHYMIDSTGNTPGKEKTQITLALQPNDRHTYIDRALYQNKSYRHTLTVGLFTSELLEDYTVTEKKLIDELAKILHENGLKTKDLWREFDLNRAPSPFMYLDRIQWAKFLKELDKQVEWRYKNFGAPELPEKEPMDADDERLLTHIGASGKCNRRCTLRKQPNMTGPHVKVLDEGTPVKITNYQKGGYYEVEAGADKTKGWIVYTSVTVFTNDAPAPSEASDKDKPKANTKDKGIPKPEIKPTMTHAEYLKWKKLTDPIYIDEFAAECEPYDKGLPEIIDAQITEDDRIQALTKQMETKSENTIFYSVIEGSPGGDGDSHCVKPAQELNSLYKPNMFKVDPIYPDLIVPPNYSTGDNTIKSPNTVPLTSLEDNKAIKSDEDYDKNYTFDFDLLNEMNKKSKGKPVNYLDPYPYDDKVYELEKHSPKIKIDEMESRLYESNHPGDPIAQPIAKNFAMVYDAMINQSKSIESRMVRLENTLAFALRALGRMGSRMNINCVYYGGQDTFGKYKTVRCMRDDRVHDACSVTIDQCLSCTRYEPIIGQIYEILDDTGLNGSVMLDEMQMSYMNLEDYKAFNRVEELNEQKKFVNVNKKEKEIPKLILDEWEKIDKDNYLKKLKEKLTDKKEYEEAVKKVKREDYAFIMNWYETEFDLQEPDVKLYPTEGVRAKYKYTNCEEGSDLDLYLPSLKEEDKKNDKDDNNKTKEEKEKEKKEKDSMKDYLEDVEKLKKLNNGEWVDTREKADTIEENKYSSENYYFEDFNKDTGMINGSIGGSLGAECRQKIVEMAKLICQDHDNLKAAYWMIRPATMDYNNKVMRNVPRVNPNEKVAIYDCSSFTNTCYKAAGLDSWAQGTTVTIQTIFKKSGKSWPASLESAKDALPGDILWHPGHVAIYLGDNKIAHAANDNYPNKATKKDIYICDLDWAFKNVFKYPDTRVFARPKELIEADEKAAALGGNISITPNSEVVINGKKYKATKIPQAVITNYTDNGSYATSGGKKQYVDIRNGQTITVPSATAGKPQAKYCASHNLPYGTQIYIPDLAAKGVGDGIYTVVDTGGHFFDFDIHVPDALASKVGKANHDVYVLRFGSGTGQKDAIAKSYCGICEFYKNRKDWPKCVSAWRLYQKMNGKLIKFHDFCKDDAKAQLNHPTSPIGN